MNTNTRKTNIFITIGAITLLVHAIGFLLPWCNMNGVKVQEGLAFIAGGSWVNCSLFGFRAVFCICQMAEQKTRDSMQGFVGRGFNSGICNRDCYNIRYKDRYGEFRGRNLHLHYYTCGKYNMLHCCMRAVDKRRHGTKSVTIIKRTSGGVLLLLYNNLRLKIRKVGF